VNQHCLPVHENCIQEFFTCPECKEPVIGLLSHAYKDDEDVVVDAFLSDVLQQRAKIAYKSWHLSRLHKSRQKEIQKPVAPSLISKQYFSKQLHCDDWTAPEDV
jgi:hypothetical protein